MSISIVTLTGTVITGNVRLDATEVSLVCDAAAGLAVGASVDVWLTPERPATVTRTDQRTLAVLI